MNHITPQQLQDFSDGITSVAVSSEIKLHLQECTQCNAIVASMRELDAAIRKVPLENVSDEFTQNVLKTLRIESSPAYLWKLFQYMAPIVALIVIAIIVWTVFQFSGAYENSEMQQSMQLTKSLYNKVGGAVTGGLSAVNSWIERYLSFAFAKNSYMLTTFLLLFFGGVALLDKYFLMPLWKKKLPS